MLLDSDTVDTGDRFKTISGRLGYRPAHRNQREVSRETSPGNVYHHF